MNSTRRTFLGHLAAVTGLVFCIPSAMAVGRPTRVADCAAPDARSPAAGAPVVSFHMDRPYLDMTGRAEPYVPPDGIRSGQALADLSDVEFLTRHAYF
jgi:hypothetical protein